MKNDMFFLRGYFFQFPLFLPTNLFSICFFVVNICLGGRGFGVVRGSFGFPLSVVGEVLVPSGGIVFQEEERDFFFTLVADQGRPLPFRLLFLSFLLTT